MKLSFVAADVNFMSDGTPSLAWMFVNRATNAAAESFYSKVKLFRAQLHGVMDVKFFLFRLTNIYAYTQDYASAPI